LEIWEEDLYDLIGTAPEATIDEIKKAYKKLAIELHPDRFPTDDAERADASLRFGKITNAYNILKDEEERAEYNFARRMGYGGGAPKNAKRALQHEDSADVVELKKSQALNQFDQGRSAHQNRNWPKAIACYKEATRLDTSVADYPAYLGLAYLQQGLKSPANSAFSKAYKLDKTHKILQENYTPPGQEGVKGKKGNEKPGLLAQLKALLEKLQGAANPPAKGKKGATAKKGAPAKKGTAPFKKASAKK
jgi:curved DNA-binding protein CbpA